MEKRGAWYWLWAGVAEPLVPNPQAYEVPAMLFFVDRGAISESPNYKKSLSISQRMWYTVHKYECGQNPYEMRKEAIMQFIDTHTMAYVGLKRKDKIESMAREIMNTGIKFKDACHVASAIYAECEYFISTDMRLLKYKTDKIKMVTPTEFITGTEGE